MRFTVSLVTSTFLLAMGTLGGCADDDPTPTAPDPAPDPTRYVVPDDVATIGEALLETTVGDTVLVRPGAYVENALYVPLSVHLIGAGPDSVVVDASGLASAGPVLAISDRIESSRPARIRGLRVRGARQVLLQITDGSHVMVDDCVFTDSERGVQIAAPRSFSEVAFDACSFTGIDGDRVSPGAAVKVSGYVDLSLRRCAFRDNRGESGPALQVWGSLGRTTVVDCDFVGNAVRAVGTAGAVSVTRSQDVDIVDCTFEDNFGGRAGGAISIRETRLVRITGSTFRANRAEASAGAIRVHDVPRLLVEADFFDNEAPRGGALELRDTQASVRNSVFARNGPPTAFDGTSSGGAIWLDLDARVDLYGSLFHANRAGGFPGGSPDGEGSSIYSTANLFHTNVLDVDGCTLSFAPEGTPLGGAFAELRVRSTNVFGNADGDWVGPLADFENVDDNTSSDPGFCDPDNDDFGPCDL